MDLQTLIALQESCEGRMSCEACPEKYKGCKDFKGILANMREPWEVSRLVEDIKDYKDENVGEV